MWKRATACFAVLWRDDGWAQESRIKLAKVYADSLYTHLLQSVANLSKVRDKHRDYSKSITIVLCIHSEYKSGFFKTLKRKTKYSYIGPQRTICIPPCPLSIWRDHGHFQDILSIYALYPNLLIYFLTYNLVQPLLFKTEVDNST